MIYKLFKTTILLFLATGLAGVAAQTIDPADILIKEAPEMENVCIFEPTDFNVDRAIAHADIVGKSAGKQLTSDFNVTYVSACGGESWPAEALSAFEYAMSIWETHLESSVPVAIEATWQELDGNVLGSAGPTRIAQIPPIGEENTWYSIAQASAMTGNDIKATAGTDFDIVININCAFDDWYFGQDSNPPADLIDFVTVVLHEIGHGIGFIGSMVADEDVGVGNWGFQNSSGSRQPIIYDLFTEDGENIPIINETVYPNPSSLLYDVLTGSFDGIFFDGNDANIVNLGSPVRLYTPFPWQGGSSYSHLDQDTFGDSDNALMRPRLDRQFSIHSPGPVMCGMLSDMGWPLGQNCFDLIGVESVISVEQIQLNFGVSNVRNIENQTLTVSNDASAEDPLSGRIVIENSNYSISETYRTFSIEPGNSLNIPVQYAPQNVNIHDAELTLLHNSSSQPNPLRISLNGEALEENSFYVLDQNYPNPFNSQTTLEYALTDPSDVLLEVYNINGQLISTLVDSEQSEGRYEVFFDASGLASGVYLYRIIVDGKADTRKLLLVK
jgi:hypothetical protein